MRIVLLVILLTVISACADHEQGYRAGYAQQSPDAWVIFGRSDYNRGFQAGQMQAAHDDWYAENEIDMDLDGLSCPAMAMNSSPVLIINNRPAIRVNVN